MPNATYISLGTLTLGASDNQVEFASIPGTYRDLILHVSGKTTGTTNIRMQFNNDTAFNYIVRPIATNGSSALSAGPESWSAMQPTYYGQWTNAASKFPGMSIQIMDYSASNIQKTMLVRNSTSSNTEFIVGRWGSTSPITNILLFTATGGTSFSSGTKFDLYGISA